MKIQIVGNKYINAALLLMLFSAAVHMLVLFFIVLKSGDFYILNYFNIIDLDIFWPSLFKDSLVINVVANVIVIGVYLAILWLNQDKKPQ